MPAWPFDLWRSLVRSVGDEVLRAVPFRHAWWQRTRLRLAAWQVQTRALQAHELSRAIAHAPRLRAASVRIEDGAVHIDVADDDGAHLGLSIRPESVHFAPQGAKELVFHLAPEERTADPRTEAVVATLAHCIALILWPGLHSLAQGAPAGSAIVERDLGARLRVDLRTLPEVRAAGRQGWRSTLLEATSLRSLEAEGGKLTLTVSLGL